MADPYLNSLTPDALARATARRPANPETVMRNPNPVDWAKQTRFDPETGTATGRVFTFPDGTKAAYYKDADGKIAMMPYTGDTAPVTTAQPKNYGKPQDYGMFGTALVNAGNTIMLGQLPRVVEATGGAPAEVTQASLDYSNQQNPGSSWTGTIGGALTGIGGLKLLGGGLLRGGKAALSYVMPAARVAAAPAAAASTYAGVGSYLAPSAPPEVAPAQPEPPALEQVVTRNAQGELVSQLVPVGAQPQQPMPTLGEAVEVQMAGAPQVSASQTAVPQSMAVPQGDASAAAPANNAFYTVDVPNADPAMKARAEAIAREYGVPAFSLYMDMSKNNGVLNPNLVRILSQARPTTTSGKAGYRERAFALFEPYLQSRAALAEDPNTPPEQARAIQAEVKDLLVQIITGNDDDLRQLLGQPEQAN